MARIMYLFFLALTGKIGPIKSIPHFSNGAKGIMGVSGQWFQKVGAPVHYTDRNSEQNFSHLDEDTAISIRPTGSDLS